MFILEISLLITSLCFLVRPNFELASTIHHSVMAIEQTLFLLNYSMDPRDWLSCSIEDKNFMAYASIIIFLEIFWWCYDFSEIIRKRKEKTNLDFITFVLHHFFEIILEFYCIYYNLQVAGVVITCLHHYVDPFINIAKFCSGRNQYIRDFSFTIMIPIWIITRLVLYPYIVYLVGEMPCSPTSVFVFLLSLIPLHLIWTFQILRIAYYKVFYGKTTDTTLKVNS